ncbi:aldo/keto reductase [Candidatus Poribacteria bacterium]|nr:aldo/keto reductase [Candidatus Poribacteria bacterium]
MTTRWSRREFLIKSSVAGATLAVAGSARGAAEADKALVGTDGMPLSVLGKTKEKVSILGFGGSGTVAKAPRLLTTAMSKGVTYIDTAEGYDGGNSEREIGKVFAAGGVERKKAFIVTKSGDHNPSNLASRLDASLERLQMDYIDALFLHNLNNPDRLDDELKATAEALKKSKKVRFFGFSCHDSNLVAVLEKAASCGFVDLFMIKYNFRDYDDDALAKALDLCAKAEVGIVAMKTGAGAVPRFDEFEAQGVAKPLVALKAVWADRRVNVAVSKMANLEQVTDNAAAAKDRKLSRAEWNLLERYAAETDHLYCRGCGSFCQSACGGMVAVADILRFRMYHDGYGDRELARELYRELPSASRDIAGVDFSAAEAACPHGLAIGDMLREAESALA